MTPLPRGEVGRALISPDQRFRYWLLRRWSPGPLLVWVMLNPSTATPYLDDATIRKVRGFSKRLGYGGFVVVNVWAFRTKDPKVLHRNRRTYA